jgi:hypothetical protein
MDEMREAWTKRQDSLQSVNGYNIGPAARLKYTAETRRKHQQVQFSDDSSNNFSSGGTYKKVFILSLFLFSSVKNYTYTQSLPITHSRTIQPKGGNDNPQV